MILKHIEGIGQVVSCVATLQPTTLGHSTNDNDTAFLLILWLLIGCQFLHHIFQCCSLSITWTSFENGFSAPLQLYTCSVIWNFKSDSCIIIFQCLSSFIFMGAFRFPILFASINVQNIIWTIFSHDFFQCKYHIRVSPMTHWPRLNMPLCFNF